MTNLPPYPDSSDDTGRRLEGRPTSTTPRWVSLVGIMLVLVLVFLLVVLHGTGAIGPGGH